MLSCRDSSCLYLNPAGLGMLARSEVSASLGTGRISGDEFLTGDSIEQDEQSGYVNGAFPLGTESNGRPRFGTIAFGYSRYQGDTNDTIATTPDGHRRSIGFGYSPLESLALGYSFTFYDDQLHSDLADLHSHAQFLHVFGIQFQPTEDLIIGGIFNLGIGQFDTEDFNYDSNGLLHVKRLGGGVGVSKNWGKFRTAIAFDYSHNKSTGNLAGVSPAVVIGDNEEGDIYNIRAGVETQIFENTFFRTGIRYSDVHYQFKRSDLRELSARQRSPGWSGGIGHIFSSKSNSSQLLRLDYAFEYLSLGNGGWEHLITIAVPFSI